MNESGRSIAAAALLQGAGAESVLVVHDDVDLLHEGGSRRGSEAGSPATTGSVRSPRRSARQDFLRLRDRRGPPRRRGDRRGRWPTLRARGVPRPETDVEALVARSADAVETIVRDGLEAAQQRYN